MPNHSRLLRFILILAGATLILPVWAGPDRLPHAGKHQPMTSQGDYPFDNQTIPTASTTPSPSAVQTTGEAVAPAPEPRGSNQCSSRENNDLQKSLLITAFSRVNPSTSNAGALSNVEQQLPALLGKSLVATHRAINPVQINESLPTAAASSDNLLAQQIQKLAHAQRTQLVLTGEIVDMAMAHPEATYNPGLYTRFLNGLFDFITIKNRFDKRERVFSFKVNLRDGFTGQTLFNKHYDTYGIWGIRKEVGFGTPLFWKSDYGRQVQGLINMASKDIGDVIECQPFIAAIDSRPGQTQITLQGGANNGLRAGDTLTLYQMVVQGSETDYAQHLVRLVNRNAAIEVREVYPSHSLGVISGTTYLTGQFLAVAP